MSSQALKRHSAGSAEDGSAAKRAKGPVTLGDACAFGGLDLLAAYDTEDTASECSSLDSVSSSSSEMSDDEDFEDADLEDDVGNSAGQSRDANPRGCVQPPAAAPAAASAVIYPAPASSAAAVDAPVPGTLIIVDWDDTLLPSSWLLQQGLRIDGRQPTEAQKACLIEAAENARRSLEIAKRLGRVIILTNGELGWVELSCMRFMPSLFPLLEGVKIRSARHDYEKLGVAAPMQWKVLAFQDELQGLANADDWGQRQVSNVISIGDSTHEREALLQSTRTFNCWSKSVKFVARPPLTVLAQQHRFLSMCLRSIVHHPGKLDLRVSLG